MTRRLILGFLAAGALAATVPSALADIDPVRLLVTVPSKVYAGQHRTIRVTVDADKGAFDIANLPIKAQVKLATSCRGTFEATSGRIIIDKALSPQPSKGAELHATASAKPSFPKARSYAVCTYITDADPRQFATDVETTLRVRHKR